ncbi:9414_t:CDS:2 [Funneliformis mosseae]|uniref:9414_t:CDS:1 n=1 Tax=Funneliformis mosseae TaxID=27381 RepID=A0A9N9CBI1_FUNMO|nr:9414_t:CDS:2 [Funneliformis mosseae]
MPIVDAQTTPSGEIIGEVIEYARYGELEDLKAFMNLYPVTYLESKDDFGNTALHMASANGHLEIVEFIIQALGSLLERVLSIQNSSGNTPLHWSALNGHEKVVKLLIKSGADAKVLTPIYEAQQNHHEKIVEFLLANVDPSKGEEKKEKSTVAENN